MKIFFFFPIKIFDRFKILLSVTHCSLDVCPCDKYVYSYVITTFQQLSWRSHHFWRSWTLVISVIQTAYGSWSVEVMVCQHEWWWCQSAFSNPSTLAYPPYIPKVLPPQPSPSLCHTIGSPCYCDSSDSDHSVSYWYFVPFDRELCNRGHEHADCVVGTWRKRFPAILNLGKPAKPLLHHCRIGIVYLVTPCSVDGCPCDKYVYSYVIDILQQLPTPSEHSWRSWTLFIFVIQPAYGRWPVGVMVCEDEWWWCQSDFSNQSTLPYSTRIPDLLRPQPSPSLCHTIGSPSPESPKVMIGENEVLRMMCLWWSLYVFLSYQLWRHRICYRRQPPTIPWITKNCFL